MLDISKIPPTKPTLPTPKERIEEASRCLTENAFDFLQKSVNEIEEHPKHSVIHFATAVELLLKARLMHEHWSLIVERVSEAEVESFLSGKCKTVRIEDAIKRLEKICGEAISKYAIEKFKKITAHRNEMIHFFHKIDAKASNSKFVGSIVKEQCACWYHLEQLIKRWSAKDKLHGLKNYDRKITQIQKAMIKNRTYLAVVFDNLQPEIEKAKLAGTLFRSCSGCGREAAEIGKISDEIFEQSCRVCNLTTNFAEVDCPEECGNRIHITAEDDVRRCSNCDHEISDEEMVSILISGSAEFPPANCPECTASESFVMHEEFYVCALCFHMSDEAPALYDHETERWYDPEDIYWDSRV